MMYQKGILYRLRHGFMEKGKMSESRFTAATPKKHVVVPLHQTLTTSLSLSLTYVRALTPPETRGGHGHTG